MAQVAVVREFLEYVASVPDALDQVPAYLHGRKPTELYVAPKLRRRADVGFDISAGVSLYPGPFAKRYTPDDLVEILRSPESKSCLVTGHPGEGKSLLLKMMARKLAKEGLARLEQSKRDSNQIALPIVLRLDDLRGERPRGRASRTGELKASLRTRLEDRYDSVGVVDFLYKHVTDRRAWLLLDGLDECPWELCSWILEELRRWECSVVVTSRSNTMTTEPYFNEEFYLEPLTPEEALTIYQRWSGRDDAIRKLADLPPWAKQLLSEWRWNALQWVYLCPLLADLAEGKELTSNQLWEQIVLCYLRFERDGSEVQDGTEVSDLYDLVSDLLMRCLPERSLRIRSIPLRALQNAFDMSPHRYRWMRAGVNVIETLESRRFLAADKIMPIVCHLPCPKMVKFLAAEGMARKLEQENFSEDLFGWDLIKAVELSAEYDEVLFNLVNRLKNPSPLIEMLGDDEEDDFFQHRLALAGRCFASMEAATKKRLSEDAQGVATKFVAAAMKSLTDAPFPIEWYGCPLLKSLQDYADAHEDEIRAVLMDRLRSQDDQVLLSTLVFQHYFGRCVLDPTVLTRVIEIVKRDDARLSRAVEVGFGDLGRGGLTAPLDEQTVRLLQNPAFGLSATMISDLSNEFEFPATKAASVPAEPKFSIEELVKRTQQDARIKRTQFEDGISLDSHQFYLGFDQKEIERRGLDQPATLKKLIETSQTRPPLSNKHELLQWATAHATLWSLGTMKQWRIVRHKEYGHWWLVPRAKPLRDPSLDNRRHTKITSFKCGDMSCDIEEGVVTVHGKDYDVDPILVRIAACLIKKRGDRIAGPDMMNHFEELDLPRIDLHIKKLPQAFQERIDSTTRGYILRTKPKRASSSHQR